MQAKGCERDSGSRRVFTVVGVRWGQGADRQHCVELRASPDNKLEHDDLPLAPWY